MKRNEANAKYKWNLTSIYKNNEEWKKDYEFVLNNYKKLSTFKGKLDNKKDLKEYLEYEKQIIEVLSKLMFYSYLSHDVDLKNTVYLEQLGLIENLESMVMSETSFAMPELNSLSDDFLNELINDKEFKNNDGLFKSILLNRKHLLSEKEENIMSLVSSFTGGFRRIYDELTETDLTLKPIIINGMETPLSTESYSLYITNKDRDIRKQAYDNLYEAYKNISHTTAMSYIYYLKSCSFDLKLRNYDSLLSASLYSEQIPEDVYYNLIKNVSSNTNLMHKYFNLLAKSKNINDMKFYDTYLSIAKMPELELSFDEQFEIVNKALSVLGNDYINKLNKAMEENWIDVYQDDNKSSGGYNFCIYGYHPQVLLNDNGNYNSLSTLAHELGHAIHSVYSNENQCFEKADISLFIAEIASTTNEILLNKYLIKNAKTKQEKLFYLDQYVKDIKATVFRQTMFSEFEDFAHKLVENNQPISVEILNNEYKSLLLKHFGDSAIIDDKIIHEWSRIGHYYRSYYVYKYATSFTTANYIATCILENKNDMINNYLTLLKSGSKDYPTNLLKEVGIDLTKNDVYDVLFKDLKETLDEIEKLLNE